MDLTPRQGRSAPEHPSPAWTPPSSFPPRLGRGEEGGAGCSQYCTRASTRYLSPSTFIGARFDRRGPNRGPFGHLLDSRPAGSAPPARSTSSFAPRGWGALPHPQSPRIAGPELMQNSLPGLCHLLRPFPVAFTRQPPWELGLAPSPPPPFSPTCREDVLQPHSPHPRRSPSLPLPVTSPLRAPMSSGEQGTSPLASPGEILTLSSSPTARFSNSRLRGVSDTRPASRVFLSWHRARGAPP